MLENEAVQAAKKLSEWVRAEVARRGWSVAHLAERSGWPNRNALTRLVNGQQRYSLDDIERLAQGFDLSVADLMISALTEEGDEMKRSAVRQAVESSLGVAASNDPRMIDGVLTLLRQMQALQEQLDKTRKELKLYRPDETGERS